MIGSIIGSIAGSFLNNAIAEVGKAYQSYVNKEISKAELDARVAQAALTARTEIEKSSNEALAKTYESFMQATSKSRLMQVVWASVTISQLLVLLWHQVGITALCYSVGKASCYPSSGTTVDWAYLLLAGCVGLGPVVLRSGPGAGNITEQLKALRR
jgi:hypothetical protein